MVSCCRSVDGAGVETPDATSFVRVPVSSSSRPRRAGGKGAIKGPLLRRGCPAAPVAPIASATRLGSGSHAAAAPARMGCCGSSAKGDVAAHMTTTRSARRARLPHRSLSCSARRSRRRAAKSARERLRPGLQGLVSDYARRRGGVSGAAAAGSFDSFCLGAAPLPEGQRAERPWLRVALRPPWASASARPSAQRSTWAAPPWVSVGRAWATCRRSPGLHHAAGARPGPGAGTGPPAARSPRRPRAAPPPRPKPEAKPAAAPARA